MWNNDLIWINNTDEEIKKRESIWCLESNLENKVWLEIDEIKYMITWLIWKEGFEYLNLIEYKRKFLEIKIFDLEKIDEYLTSEQTRLLIQYKNELYESSIYWTPLNETEDRRNELMLWEELFFISKSIEKILEY